MELAFTFYLSVYGLAALSAAILAWAEESVSITVFTVPVAVCALLLNERHRFLRLNDFWAFVVGLVGCIYPAYEFYTGNEESRLLAAAHLLTILQWLLLFYKKSAHQYWWICAASCLQIALAAVLTNSPMFGLLILIYMFWALWTLSVFTLLLARLRYSQDEIAAAEPGEWDWPPLGEATVPPTSLHTPSRNQVLISEVRSSFQCDPHETDINWRFAMGVGGMSASALWLGMIFFLLTPRLWLGSANPFEDTTLEGTSRSVSGFSEKVHLNDYGRILESSAPVLELRIVDEQTSNPVPLADYLLQLGQVEPLLRGSVLGDYRRGEWWPVGSTFATSFNRRRIFSRDRNRKYVRQSIRLEPIGSQTLFSLADPEYGFIDDQVGEIKITQESRALQFRFFRGPIRGAIRYHLVVPERTGTADHARYQTLSEKRSRNSTPVNPAEPNPDVTLIPRVSTDQPYLKCSRDLKVIHQLADRFSRRNLTALPAKMPSQSQIAAEIVRYLRDSGEFQYSLDQSRRDPKLDPIEDFLTNRKTGHCQYFATALALLLRASGIPSRVVTGFKGGIESGEPGVLEVQQRHAHAWVEAYLDDGWVTLDATPPSRDEFVEAIGERVRWYHYVFALGSTLWNDYVINLSFTRQQRDLYAPLQSLGQAVTNQVRGTSGFWSGLKKSLLNFWEHPEQLFSFRGGLIALGLMLSAVGLFYLLRILLRMARRQLWGAIDQPDHRTTIEFYERFLALLKPLGLSPKPYQTQLEFAQQVESAWLACELPVASLPLARDISAAFYRLRFGQEVLNPEQEEQIRSALQQLESHTKR